MTKASWAVVCVLVVFNSAVITASFTGGIRGAQCDGHCMDGTFTFTECWHQVGAPNGTDCQTGACFVVVMTYVGCGSGESDCPKNFDPSAHLAYQKTYRTSFNNPCQSAWQVNWNEIAEPNNPCIGRRVFEIACESPSCWGLFLQDEPERLGRYICGCR